MNIVPFRRAFHLVRRARANGLVLAFSEAKRALQRYGNQFHRAYQFVARNARRGSDGQIQSRITQKFGLINDIPDMPQKRARIAGTYNCPKQDVVEPNVTVGDRPELLRSKKTYFTHRGRGNIMKNLVESCVYRWQSITDYNESFRAHQLNKFNNSESQYCDMPMYCYNLTGLGGNQRVGNDNYLLKVPFFRLRKSVPMSTTLKNYYWVKQQGVNNSMTSDSFANVLERDNSRPGILQSYRNVWNNIQMLIQCGRLHECKIHVALVKFKNWVGPRRTYFNTLSYETPEFDDDDEVGPEQSRIDSTWEAFWSHRVVHPLTEFKPDNKTSLFTFLKHEVVTVNPQADPSREDFRVVKNLFVRDGRVMNCRVGYDADSNVAGTHANPVTLDVAGEPGNYNKVLPTQTVNLYDDYEKDVWLLIWADMLPGNNDGSNFCGFDLKVRSKFEGVRAIQT